MEQKGKLELIKKYIKEKKGKDVIIDLKKPRTMDLGHGMSAIVGAPLDDAENKWYIDKAYKYAKDFYDGKKATQDRNTKEKID